MSQIETGIRSILSHPWVYELFQNLVGAKKLRRTMVKDYFELSNDSSIRVLDIGCGTADILDLLPKNIDYVGYDASEQYINYARKKYSSKNAKFYPRLVEETDTEQKFDLVLAFGILHHLDDTTALNLFKLASKAVSDKGRLITFDPCFVKNQSRMSYKFVSSDRGQNVRTFQEYGQLSKQVFNSVDSYHRNNLLYIPYDHTILICKN